MSQPVHPPAGPPYVHPPFARPPKPEVPLGRPLLRTCVFSLLGVVLLVILGAVAAIADNFT